MGECDTYEGTLYMARTRDRIDMPKTCRVKISADPYLTQVYEEAQQAKRGAIIEQTEPSMEFRRDEFLAGTSLTPEQIAVLSEPPKPDVYSTLPIFEPPQQTFAPIIPNLVTPTAPVDTSDLTTPSRAAGALLAITLLAFMSSKKRRR